MARRRIAAAASATMPAVTASLDEFEREFLTRLRSQYRDEFDRLRAAGTDPSHLGSPVALAERVAASTPLTPSPWEELAGPFYDTTGLTSWLGISRQALSDRVRNKSVLGLRTGDGQWVYPAWQFMPDRSILPQLPELLRILASGTDDRWTWMLWLTAPDARGRLAYEQLADGDDPSALLAEARADAASWAS